MSGLRVAAATAAFAAVGCVPTIRYAALPPTTESVRVAAAAAAESRSGSTGRGTLQLCLQNGLPKLIRNATVEGDRICERYMRPNADWRLPPQPATECTALSEVTAIGKPRDSRAFGYYPVPIPMRCPVER